MTLTLDTVSVPVIIPTDPPRVDDLNEPRGRVHVEPLTVTRIERDLSAEWERLLTGEGYSLNPRTRPLGAHIARRKPRPFLARLRYALAWKG